MEFDDIAYYLYRPKFPKDIPVFTVTGTGERVRPCYDADGKLLHKGNEILMEFEDGRRRLVGAEILFIKEGGAENDVYRLH